MTNNILSKAVCSISILGLSLVNMSCDVKPAEVPRSNVEATQVKDFSLPDVGKYISLGNNQFFLWPDNIPADQAATVFDISNQIDTVSADRTKLDKRQTLLQNDPAVVAAKQQVQVVSQDLSKKVSALNKARADLKAAVKKKLTQAQADLKTEQGKPTPDPATLDKLNAQILAYGDQITDLGNSMPKLDVDQAALKLQIDALNLSQQQLDTINANLAGLLASNQTELDKIDVSLKSMFVLGNSLIHQAMAIVEWYDVSNGVVTFKVKPDGSLYASISSWIIETQTKSFSSDPGPAGKPTIRNLKYTPHGGVLDFDVVVYEDEKTQADEKYIFNFHISRNNYQAGVDRTCFQGDLTRTEVKTGEVRKGIAKLVDTNG